MGFTIFDTYSSQESELQLKRIRSENVSSEGRHNGEREVKTRRPRSAEKTITMREEEYHPRDNVLKFAVALDKT